MTGDSGADVVCFTDAMPGTVFAGTTRAAGYTEALPGAGSGIDDCIVSPRFFCLVKGLVTAFNPFFMVAEFIPALGKTQADRVADFFIAMDNRVIFNSFA